MICKYCRHEFNVEEESLGQELRCPNCSSTVQITDKTVVCTCPTCKTKLSVEMWMIGTTAPCPVCSTEVKLSLDAATSRKLFAPIPSGQNTDLSLKRGDIFGKYKIEGCLGIGGMGEVYLATHSFLGTSCAIKLLKKDVTVREEDKQRLLREARLTSSIHHQNLIAVLDADIDPSTGMIYIVMEYVDGISIDQILENGPMQEERVLQIIRQVAEALQAAEEMQIVHRDIKPANIMLTSRGKVKLADLGIAKTESDTSVTLTMDNAILGTPHYASPEQLRSSHKVDIRADIYSLGATMYHMLSGDYPFPGDSVFNIMAQVLEKEPEPLESKAQVSSMTVHLVQEMMAKNPANRPANMTDLIARIDRVLQFQQKPRQESAVREDAAPTAGTSAAPKLELRPRGEKKELKLQTAPVLNAAAGTSTQPPTDAMAKKTLTTPTGKMKTEPLAKTAPVKTQKAANHTDKPRITRSKKTLIFGSLAAACVLVVAALLIQSRIVAKQMDKKAADHTEKVDDMLDQLEAAEVRPEDVRNIARFKLQGRADFAAFMAAKLAKDSKNNAFQSAQLQFYTTLNDRLARELQIRKNSPKSALKKLSGSLFGDDGEDLLAESAQFLIDPPEGDSQAATRAKIYRELKDYAVKCQTESTFRTAPGGVALRTQLQNSLASQDPLLLIQAMLLFGQEQDESNISEQTMQLLLQDLEPNFSYSHFPPSALTLPESMVLALLAMSWDEVDGISYKKSNLIAELAKPADAIRPAVVAALLNAGCNPSLPNIQGMTPLHWALKRKTASLVSDLLCAAPDLNVRLDNRGFIEWGIAQSASPEILKLLSSAGLAIPEEISPENVAPQYSCLWEKEKAVAQAQPKILEKSSAPASGIAIQKTMIPLTPYVPQKPSSLDKALSCDIAGTALNDLEKFTLAGRLNYANTKLALTKNRQSLQGNNYYITQALQFYTDMYNRLQQELQNRTAAENTKIQSVSGNLCPEGKNLLATMQALLSNELSGQDERPTYYRLLKNYAIQCQNDNQFKGSAEAKKMRQELLEKRDQFDPLIHIQALLLFIYTDEGISPQTMVQLLADLTPDFSYCKFPPEALELPEPVIIDLLGRCWEEVDGASYGKSNLITEMSRTNQGGRINVVTALLAAGCNIDTPDAKGLYPLHWSIRNSQFLRQVLTITPDMQVKVGGKGVIEWGMEEDMLYSTARRLLRAGAPLPKMPENKFPPNYRGLIRMAPAGNP